MIGCLVLLGSSDNFWTFEQHYNCSGENPGGVCSSNGRPQVALSMHLWKISGKQGIFQVGLGTLPSIKFQSIFFNEQHKQGSCCTCLGGSRFNPTRLKADTNTSSQYYNCSTTANSWNITGLKWRYKIKILFKNKYHFTWCTKEK